MLRANKQACKLRCQMQKTGLGRGVLAIGLYIVGSALGKECSFHICRPGFVPGFFFQASGAGVLAIGIWMRVDETIVNYLHVVNIHQTDPLIDHAGTIFIVVGALVFCVGFLGCFGAIRSSQGVLFLVRILFCMVLL